MADNWKALAAIFAGLAAAAIPSVITKLAVLGKVIAGLISLPALLVGAIVTAGVWIVTEWDKWESSVLKFGFTLHKTLADSAVSVFQFVRKVNDSLGMLRSDAIEKYAKNQIAYYRQVSDVNYKAAKEIEESNKAMVEADKALELAGPDAAKQLQRDLQKLIENNNAANAATSSLKEQLEILNQMYNNNVIGVGRYNRELTKLTKLIYEKRGRSKLLEELHKVDLGNLQRQFDKGKISLEEFTQATYKVNLAHLNTQLTKGYINAAKYYSELDKLNQEKINIAKAEDIRALRNLDAQIKASNASMADYREAVRDMNQVELRSQLDAQLISLEEYNQKMVEISGNQVNWKRSAAVGLENYLKDAENFNAQFSKVVTSSMGHLEDAFVDFTETGKFNFEDMANSIIKDLNRVIIRAMIMAPILRGLQEGTGLDLGAAATKQADGGGWDKGVQFFANGGVVNSPTMFKHSGGLGVMGEAGPEAIMPLSRGADGKLGVRAEVGSGANVVINITNNSQDSEVQQSESTNANGDRQIDVLIVNKVKEAFGSGTMDSTMKNTYGLNRRGY